MRVPRNSPANLLVKQQERPADHSQSTSGHCRFVCYVKVTRAKSTLLLPLQIFALTHTHRPQRQSDGSQISARAIKVVTGSHDRTLKVWDLRSIACIETKFAGSSCNDLVTTDSLGSTIISGHYDKKLRFWDIRTEKQADDILMPAKITSIDMTKDGYYLICSIRDDTIKLIDLRKNQIISSFSHENFKLSSDGLVYIWSILGDLEATLKGHNSAVNAVSWCPNSNALATVGKGKRCIIYTES
ncbi:unnamed protein product [Ceratitis capitata]|uniref:(Mediterranean fruit fly) hypothetical protein n=1 Tax=Ceratitis capitata TaxID=7213 RepID=A0A811U343_CERCA|nr:unnamed protein product [Ceratitis capitata]